MFEIRIICDTPDVPRVAQAVLGSVGAVSVRRFPTRDRARTRLYITAEQRGRHDDCPACDGDGVTLWFLPDGSREQRPCTGLSADALHAAGLTQGSSQREPWQRTTGH
ncbi:hypothetical protein GUR47_26200 [Streptomyces tendae]|uniref:Uncharacterized protein n=1 Tax=Streptomyces tendae TaxID=1932 RepID=A0A6B3QSE1_STRTE|nr:hypothetical protein [Streptomyces tendae]NEV90120.1 hypothetical protein [Streptomyces tendae]